MVGSGGDDCKVCGFRFHLPRTAVANTGTARSSCSYTTATTVCTGPSLMEQGGETALRKERQTYPSLLPLVDSQNGVVVNFEKQCTEFKG